MSQARRARAGQQGRQAARHATALLVGLLSGLAPLRAATIHVPIDYPSIQAAIAAAAEGDTILVAPGTYHELIDFLGKDIAVVGEGGAGVTTIDGTGIRGSVVTIASGEPPTALLQGFTITGGSGRQNAPNSTWYGGGIYLGSYAPIRDCIVTGNHVPPAGEPGDATGGGAYILFGTLQGCAITGNSADPLPGWLGRGGGVGGDPHLGIQSQLLDCAILGNSADYGGGVMHVTPTGCLIEGNAATKIGGGFFDGGSFDFFPTTQLLRHCTLRGNTAGSKGGGAFIIAASLSDASIVAAWDCLFVDNTAPVGDGLSISLVSGVHPATVSLCTFVRDTLHTTYDATVYDLVVDSCIFHEPPSFPVIGGFDSVVRYCLVPGGFPGTGNIDADPLFVDAAGGDFHLQLASPCRNAGNPSLPVTPVYPDLASDTDVDGEPRLIEGRLDMGIDEVSPDCNGNGLPDYVDLADGTSADCNANSLPDECEPFADCNGNGQFDPCDIAAGLSLDCNGNGVPDECEPFTDCDGNGVFDACDIADGTTTDYNGNGIPDPCEVLPDCDGNGVPDLYDVVFGNVPDCNANGVPDSCDLAAGTSSDIDGNGVPDECHGLVYVPRDASTIQAGIDLAQPGDSVIVAPGTYSGPGNTNIRFVQSSVLLTSQFGPQGCILDGGHLARFFDFTPGNGPTDITVRGLTLRHGFAATGGAMALANGASPLIERCLFEENRASLAGGAVLIQSGAAPLLRECVFLRNEGGNGGALRVGGGGHVTVEHGTFVDNAATLNGGSIRVINGADVELRDCILRGGSAGNGDELSVEDAGSLLQVSYSDVAGGQAGVFVAGGGTLAWGAGVIDADPLFASAAADDLHLLPGSPCINTGDPAGAPDPDLSPPDMGAYAYSPWTDLGGGVAGSAGLPLLAVNGPLTAGQPVTFTVSQVPPLQPVTLVLGTGALGVPFKGGVFWPTVNALLAGLPADDAGGLVLAGPWPPGLPSGFSFWTQVWFADGGAPFGVAGSNGVRGTAP